MMGLACTDLEDVALDAESFDRPSEAGAGSDPAGLLQGAYNQLNGFSDQAGLYALLEHTSDEMQGPTRGTDWSDFGVWRQLHLHAWDPSHEYVFSAWNTLNLGQLRATQVIEAPGATEKQKAEASFLRAVFLFYIVDLYGQVPIRLDLDDPEEIPTVLSRSEATDRIIDDLDFAVANLPALTNNTGVATLEAAHFLRAKVYLNRAVYTAASASGPYDFSNADMQEVINSVDAIIGTGSLSLSDSYWDNFIPTNRTASTEIIFARRNEIGNAIASVQNRFKMTLHYNQTPDGWNGFTTVADFYNKWGDTDDERKGEAIQGITDRIGLRAGFLEGQQYAGDGTPLTDRGGAPLVFTPDVSLLYSNERQGIRVIKYLPDPDNLQQDLIGTDYILFRFADAWLMKAEALFRSGNTAEALSMVNELRIKRDADPLTSLSESALLDERGFELYWEGWRRNDQIRFGTFLEAYQNKEVSPMHVVLFPIPQRAMDTNPNFTQNPGY